MTKDHLLKFTITELSSVIVECISCKIHLSYPIEQFGTASNVMPELPKNSPQCNGPWYLDRPESPATKFLLGLAKLRLAVDGDRENVTPHLSIRDDSPDQPK